MLRIFSPEKIRRLRLGLNLQTWVPEASMLTTRPPKLQALNDILVFYSSQQAFNSGTKGLKK
jgi:hypothetical protein